MGFPCGASGKEPACQCRRHKRHGFHSWVGKIPWSRGWLTISVSWPRKSHGQRSLADYSPWGCKELVTAVWLSTWCTWWISGAWVLVRPFSHVWLFVTLWTVANQALLSMGFSRQEYWSGSPFPPGDLLTQGSNPCLLHGGRILYHWATWEATDYIYMFLHHLFKRFIFN